jgi:hypothetical protein
MDGGMNQLEQRGPPRNLEASIHQSETFLFSGQPSNVNIYFMQ